LTLYFVRHGETEWSLSGQHTGHSDIPLTPRGEDQARALASRLRAIHFDHILTSPRQRARRTCELAGLAAAATVDPDLSEWDYGEYEGRRTVDIRKERPDWNIFEDGCPGGESATQISDRVDRTIARLCALSGNIIVFSHGQFGCVLATRWIGLPVASAKHFAMATASLSILGYQPRHPETPVISLWNSQN
jgi:probable phosphoglycerate mutase